MKGIDAVQQLEIKTTTTTTKNVLFKLDMEIGFVSSEFSDQNKRLIRN